MNNYLKIIYNYILMHINPNEDIKDIMQDTMLAICQGPKGFDSKCSLKTWIIGITRRKVADYYRKFYKSKDNQTVDIFEYSDYLRAQDDIGQTMDRVIVENAVGTLSSIEKELVYLIFTVQLTYKQIEQITGIPIGTIKSKMFSIKFKLKSQLEKGGCEYG